MTKLFLSAVLVAALGSVSIENVHAKGSNLGVSQDLTDSIAQSSFKKKKKSNEASSTSDAKRSKRKKK